MSVFDDLSLAMIPSGFKDGKLYSVIPSDGSGDFTFSRGTNLAATRVNAQGLIEKGRENLLLQSNQFDTSWLSAGTTRTSGQSGYDGSSDAWLLESTNTGQSSVIQSVSQSGVQTASVYAKTGTTDWMFLYLVGSPDKSAWFNLGNGTLGNTTGIDSSIKSVGNGWYRCSISYDVTISSIRIYVSDGNNNVSSSMGANIYIQDAQLEVGLVATDYIETTTTTAQAGILEDMPRLDYSGGATCPSLLLEPERTNEVTYSEDFSQSYWTKSCEIESNTIIQPDNAQSGFNIVEKTSNAYQYWYKNNFAVTIGSKYTFSTFVKYINLRYIQLTVYNGGDYSSACFDLINQTFTTSENGSYTATNAKIDDYGNGWLRIQYTFTSPVNNPIISICTNNTTTAGYVPLYIGTGLKSAVWGAQVEAGSYATSYIPTHGTSVTRSGDVCNNAGDSTIFNDSEGVLFAEIASLNGDSSSNREISLSDGTTGNALRFYYAINYENRIIPRVDAGGSTVWVGSVDVTTKPIKVALRYSSTGMDFYVNGTKEVTTNTSPSFTNSLRSLQMRRGDGNTGSDFYGEVRQLLYFNEALTDAELQDLTS